MNQTPNSTVVVNQIIIPKKEDFFDKKGLASELSISTDTIDKWMRKDFLKINKHYFVKDTVIRFYYPAIKILLVPDQHTG